MKLILSVLGITIALVFLIVFGPALFVLIGGIVWVAWPLLVVMLIVALIDALAPKREEGQCSV